MADGGLLNCGGTLGDPLETSLSGDPELGSLVLVSDSIVFTPRQIIFQRSKFPGHAGSIVVTAQGDSSPSK